MTDETLLAAENTAMIASFWPRDKSAPRFNPEAAHAVARAGIEMARIEQLPEWGASGGWEGHSEEGESDWEETCARLASLLSTARGRNDPIEAVAIVMRPATPRSTT